MLHPSLAPRGGAENYLLELAAGLENLGHQVKILTLADIGKDSLAARFQGEHESLQLRVRFHLLDIFGMPHFKLLRMVRDFAPDVVHVHNWQRLRLMTLRFVSRRWKTYATVHDYALADPHSTLMRHYSRASRLAFRLRYSFAVRLLSRVVWLFPAQRTHDILTANVPKSPLRYRVLPLGVRDKLQLGGLTMQPNRSFGYLGALEPHKGVDLLLEALESLPPTLNFSFHFAGAGSLASSVRELAERDSRVHFHGSVSGESKKDVFRVTRWLVFPSTCYENFSIVCCEAVLAGRPVLSSRIAAPPMVPSAALHIFDEKLGSTALAEALVKLLDTDSESYQLQVAEIAAAAPRLNFDQHVSALAALYLDREER